MRPRICTYPESSYSLGNYAIEIYESTGQKLDDWQKGDLEVGLGCQENGKWSAFEVADIISRQNGKGEILAALGLAGLYLFNEKLIGHSAHEYKTAMEGFRRLLDLITNTDDLRRKVKKVINTNGEEGIELLNGNRIRFLARSKGAGRGFTFHRIFWDEAYALTDVQVGAQMPTLSAVPNGQIWYTSSPPLDAATGGVMFRIRRRGLTGTDTSLAYMDYGAEGCLDNLSRIDLGSRELWTQTNPALLAPRSSALTYESIQREYNSMSPENFARERLGIWPPDLSEGFQVIPGPIWTAATDVTSQIVGPLVFSPAVSLDRKRASIGVAGRRVDGKVHIEVVKTFEGSSEIATLVPTLAGLKALHGAVAIVADEYGPTGSLVAPMQQAGLDPITMSTGDIARAFGMFYDGISGDDDARNIYHLGQTGLNNAASSAITRDLGEGKTWDRKHASTDLTQLVSVTNAYWGYVVHRNNNRAYALVEWR